MCIQALSDRDLIKKCLVVSANSEVLGQSLSGELGSLARAIVYRDALRLFVAAEEELKTATIRFLPENSADLSVRTRITNGREWSPYEWDLCSAIAGEVARGEFVDEVMSCLEKTYQWYMRIITDMSRGDVKQSKHLEAVLFGDLFVLARYMPIGVIIHGAGQHRYATRSRETKYSEIDALLGDLPNAIPPVLYFIITVAIPPGDEHFLRFVPSLLTASWNQQIYHLTLEALQFTQNFRDVAENTTTCDRIRNVLQQLHHPHLFISTTIIETMSIYDMIDLRDQYSGYLEQLRDALSRPDDPEAQRMAIGAVSSYFDDIHSEYVGHALSQLSEEEHTRLLLMAALQDEHQFHTLWILNELLKHISPETFAPFEKCAVRFPTSAILPQDAVASYFLSMSVSASYRDVPPEFTEQNTPQSQVLHAFGAMVFWINKSYSEELKRKLCSAFIDRLFSEGTLFPFVADALHLFVEATFTLSDRFGRPPVRNSLKYYELVEMFSTEFKLLLQRSLQCVDVCQNVLYPHCDKERLTMFLITALGAIGDEATISLLERYVDFDIYGKAACEAVLNIRTSPVISQRESSIVGPMFYFRGARR